MDVINEDLGVSDQWKEALALTFEGAEDEHTNVAFLSLRGRLWRDNKPVVLPCSALMHVYVSNYQVTPVIMWQTHGLLTRIL